MPDKRDTLRSLADFFRDKRTWADLATIDAVRVLSSRNSLMLDCTLQPEGTKVSARLGVPYAGDGNGLVMKPRPGDEVLLIFPRGDLNKAIAVAGIYNGVDTIPEDYGLYGLVLDGREGDDARAHIRGNVSIIIDVNNNVIVKVNDLKQVAGNRTVNVDGAQAETVGEDATMAVEGDRTAAVAGDDTLIVTGSIEINSAVNITLRAPLVQVVGAQTQIQLADTALTLERLIKENFYQALKTHTHPDNGWQSPQLKNYVDEVALTSASKSE